MIEFLSRHLSAIRNFLFGVLTGSALCGIAMHTNPAWSTAVSLVNSACAVAMLAAGLICFLADQRRIKKEFEQFGRDLQSESKRFANGLLELERNNQRRPVPRFTSRTDRFNNN